MYGKISRYKLDEYLQLFDFPSPNITCEKRFTTSVPLQRLFFMNSEFAQQQAERLVRKAAADGTDTARIQGLYSALFGRPATDEEVQAGLEYLQSEPLKEYEESKKNAAEKKDKKPDLPKTGKPAGEVSGMMKGVVPGAGAPGDKEAKNPPLPVTTWGRYAKVLMSSSEFLYVD